MLTDASAASPQIIPTVGVDGQDGDKNRRKMLQHFCSLVDTTASKAKFLKAMAPRPQRGGAAANQGPTCGRGSADDAAAEAPGDADAAACAAGGSASAPRPADASKGVETLVIDDSSVSDDCGSPRSSDGEEEGAPEDAGMMPPTAAAGGRRAPVAAAPAGALKPECFTGTGEAGARGNVSGRSIDLGSGDRAGGEKPPVAHKPPETGPSAGAVPLPSAGTSGGGDGAKAGATADAAAAAAEAQVAAVLGDSVTREQAQRLLQLAKGDAALAVNLFYDGHLQQRPSTGAAMASHTPATAPAVAAAAAPGNSGRTAAAPVSSASPSGNERSSAAAKRRASGTAADATPPKRAKVAAAPAAGQSNILSFFGAKAGAPSKQHPPATQPSGSARGDQETSRAASLRPAAGAASSRAGVTGGNDDDDVVVVEGQPGSSAGAVAGTQSAANPTITSGKQPPASKLELESHKGNTEAQPPTGGSRQAAAGGASAAGDAGTTFWSLRPEKKQKTSAPAAVPSSKDVVFSSSGAGVSAGVSTPSHASDISSSGHVSALEGAADKRPEPSSGKPSLALAGKSVDAVSDAQRVALTKPVAQYDPVRPAIMAAPAMHVIVAFLYRMCLSLSLGVVCVALQSVVNQLKSWSVSNRCCVRSCR